jgi:hypothetical protein
MVLVTVVVLAASWSDGGLSLDEVNDVVAFRAGDLVGCAKGRVTGEAVLQFGVDASVCIAEALRQWTWPARARMTAHAPRSVVASSSRSWHQYSRGRAG